MSVIAGHKIEESIVKHRVDVSHRGEIHFRATELEANWIETRGFNDDQYTKMIAVKQARGQHHSAATVWFVQMARKQNLNLNEAFDLLVALAIGKQ